MVPSIRFFIICIFIQIRLISALGLTYCSGSNTGSEIANSSIWQSNGLCHDKCNGYALAIVHYQDCWCSDYLPADTVSTNECNMKCPGFPSEHCGGDDLYGYIYLNEPKGTVGSSSSSTQQTSSTTTLSSSTSTSSTSTSTSTTPSSTSTWSPTTSSTSTTYSSTWSEPSTTSTSSSTTSSTWSPSTTSTTSSSSQYVWSESSTSSSTTSTSSTSSSTWSPSTSSTSSSSSSSSTYSSSSSSSSSSSTSSSSSSSFSSTSSSTTSSSSSLIPKTTSSTTSTRSSSSSISSSFSSSSSASPTPVITSIIVSVSTVAGGQSTQYITTVSSDGALARATGANTNPNDQEKDDNDHSFFHDKAKVAGVFTAVGVVGAVFLVLLSYLLMKCCLLKKRDDDDYDDEDVIGVEGYSRGAEPNGKYTYPIVTRTNILNDEDNSSTDDTVYNEKTNSGNSGNVTRQGSLAHRNDSLNGGNGNNGPGANGGQNGHRRNLSIISTDFGTPIIDNHGDSTYVDQRLDARTFSHIHEQDEVLSLNDNTDYSRRVSVWRVTN